jgi:hypothetical protein|tara:strand:- start:134 stop:238 length:105 start_codon:yes stop_codon:yes gene_type:complete
VEVVAEKVIEILLLMGNLEVQEEEQVLQIFIPAQ